ncbi:Histone-lysine N-methyltransferase SETMAR [Eumeta japonica]|uniref:Histone-lysine N-methyltransferase SETMAR n=1 Tax=Eumeta variegata TaxID=151549 RepID=A0A4C1UMR6_EUMVA|nr:Histone-lysine N-methyltransferase SETMAR [Eumeta japonica]
MSQVYQIFREYLAVRKFCTRWIPHNFTETQKFRGNDWCHEMIQIFAGGDANYDIVRGDESLIYCYDPKAKRQSAEWVFFFEWDWKGIIRYELLRWGNHQLETLLPTTDEPQARSREKQLELINGKGVIFHHDDASPHTSLTTQQIWR